MNNVMLDLETMGNGSNAAIVAIGAVAFDIETRELGPRFYTLIELESSVECGGQMDAGTVMWWMKQSDVARAELCRSAEHINVVLQRFDAWVSTLCDDPATNLCVWGNGAAFDNVILANAYRRARMEVPWQHWNDRCYRTVKALHRDVKMQRAGTHHHALDDAISQAQHLMAMLNPLPTTEASNAHHSVPSQPLQPSAVGGPVGGTISGYTPIVVEIYAIGSGITLPGELSDLTGREGTLELEANGLFFVFDPLAACVTQRFVPTVKGNVAAVGQAVEAVDEAERSEVGFQGHVGVPPKTAILMLPQGYGKTTLAPALAHWLGCTHVVDDWDFLKAVEPGALHLTNAMEVSA